MIVTLILPSVGKIRGEKYIRAWQMEPLPIAQLAALTPENIELKFFDDRMESIDYSAKTDLVAISVETYTARRAYQIAQHFKQKNIPVVMGGFHATLCPNEVAQHANSVVIGSAEGIWTKLLSDFENGTLQKLYSSTTCDFTSGLMPDRKIYAGKNYLKINLIEAGRGCRFRCEFCSIHNFFGQNYLSRPISDVIAEIKILKPNKRLFFFVDDNIIGNHEKALALFEALIPLKIKWVGQADITITRNEKLLDTMVKSGCQGVLIGFESLHPDTLKQMNKGFNYTGTQLQEAIIKVHKKGLRIYATFLFGYGHDSEDDFKRVLDFCLKTRIFMVGFNHLTPFPGTALYSRLQNENRLLYDKWWLHPKYRYGQIPFTTTIETSSIEKMSLQLRKKFYSVKSILNRMRNFTNISTVQMFVAYISINLMLRADSSVRMRFPLGDDSDTVEIS